MLGIGDTAAEFELMDQFDQARSLQKLLVVGDLVLYFYPIDFSPVCTAQACLFRDKHAELEGVGAHVVGISSQDRDSHQRFTQNYELPFPLLCDPDRAVAKAYGVLGPLGVGVRRATFLIDKNRTICNRVVADVFLGQHAELINQTLAGIGN